MSYDTYQPPYATASAIVDCQKQTSGYSPASYSITPSCDSTWPNCDNRSYSAYALPSAYNGFYDQCFKTRPGRPACDLKHANASPKVILDCWDKCCKPSPLGLSDCNKKCHDDCVVNDYPVIPGLPNPF
jgi:hypothetical protein